MEATLRGLPVRVIAFGYHRGRKAARIAQIGKTDPNAIDYYITQKFDASGRIVETAYTEPQGKIKTITKYSYGEKSTEAIVTGEKGELLASKRETLDERGNAVEIILQSSNKKTQDRSFLIYESFDEFGNWTKRTEFEDVTENGKTTRVPVMTTFRTFTYYGK
jgi:heme-degrading monooxygenase HmoA